MQMAMQNMNVVFVAIFCQELTYCAYERWLDLTLMYEWQFCTELRWDQIPCSMIIPSYLADDVGHLNI